MSLRIRLLAVAMLAIVALVVAAVALRDLARDNHAGRVDAVVAANRIIVGTLQSTLSQTRPAEGPSSLAWRADLRRHARVAVGPAVDTRGGYCFADGTILEEEAQSFRGRPSGTRRGPPGLAKERLPARPAGSGGGQPPGAPDAPRSPPQEGPPDDGPPPPPDGPGPDGPPPRDGPPPHDDGPPPHDDGVAGIAVGATPPAMPHAVREALQQACSARAAPGPTELRVAFGHDAILISLGEDVGGVRAFALRMVIETDAREGGAWSMRLLVLTFITLLLVAVAVDALLAVRRGATGLSRALSTIEADLRAEVPPVPGKEFADVAERIQRVATHLADARERERSLERKIAHDNRLASLGRVVAGVAHEVRNPLTGMKLVLDGLARRSLDARSAEDVEVCLSELARLEHLVTSLLGVARSGETGRFVQDIAGLVDERLAVARDLARGKDVELERVGEARIFAVRDVLVRVMDNLVRNAIEASPTGGKVRVVITATKDGLEIDVQDEGAGVPDAAREELFEPFRTTKPEGTGLGLWLSHTALTAQGASLVHRREGGITHFVVGLPKEPS